MATSASSSFSGKIPTLDSNHNKRSIYFGKTTYQDECEIYPLPGRVINASDTMRLRNEGFDSLATPVSRLTRCKSFNGTLSPKNESRNRPWNLRSALTGINGQSKSDNLNGPMKRHSAVHTRRPSEQPSQSSKITFKQLDLSNTHHTMEPPPLSVGRRPFWIMRMIHVTISKGGYLSSRLFVPKDVWTQKGIKFAGAEKKVSAMEFLLHYVTEKAVHLPSPHDAVSCQHALEATREFHFHAEKLRGDLTRTFPFVGPSENLQRNNTKRNFSKFNNIVKTIGRNVKNTASTAYELMGNSGKGANYGDLSYYGLLVSGVCDKCQVFDQWLECAQRLREKEESCSAADNLIMEIHIISNIMREAFIEIVLRDVEMLLDRYIRKMRKSFTRLSWDDQDAED